MKYFIILSCVLRTTKIIGKTLTSIIIIINIVILCVTQKFRIIRNYIHTFRKK